MYKLLWKVALGLSHRSAPFCAVEDPLKPTTFFCRDTVGHHSNIKRQGSSFTYSLETKERQVNEKDLRNHKNEKN